MCVLAYVHTSQSQLSFRHIRLQTGTPPRVSCPASWGSSGHPALGIARRSRKSTQAQTTSLRQGGVNSYTNLMRVHRVIKEEWLSTTVQVAMQEVKAGVSGQLLVRMAWVMIGVVAIVSCALRVEIVFLLLVVDVIWLVKMAG